MIPKIIHYCWFGGKEKPRLMQKCVASWRRFAPDFQLIEWNEGNFDVDAAPFTRDAYADGNYAFVSDYARAKALQAMGGVYLDTDMELLRPLDEFLGWKLFAGFEPGDFVACGIIGSVPGHALWEAYLRHYDGANYWNADGSRFCASNVPMFTSLLEQRGLARDGSYQCLDGIAAYPPAVFYPLDYRTGRLRVTPETAAIHHYAASWLPWQKRIVPWLKKQAGRFLPR